MEASTFYYNDKCRHYLIIVELSCELSSYTFNDSAYLHHNIVVPNMHHEACTNTFSDIKLVLALRLNSVISVSSTGTYGLGLVIFGLGLGQCGLRCTLLVLPKITSTKKQIGSLLQYIFRNLTRMQHMRVVP